MTSGSRAPTMKERENNKRRERKRRAIAARIFAGLRQFGNFKLPKHCDNNEVLKALCREAGWIVEDDGTTYKKADRGKNADLCVPKPSPSHPEAGGGTDGLSTVEWQQKGISAPRAPSSGSDVVVATSSSAQNPSGFPPLQVLRKGSCSAPVTPPLTSPRIHYMVKQTECWAELSTNKVAGDGGAQISSDCAATAFSNACGAQGCHSLASGTSTPTYPPPVFVVSGASHFHHVHCSEPPTPFYPSGASTPTTHSSPSLRTASGYNFSFAAAAALASVQQQQQQQQRQRQRQQPLARHGTETTSDSLIHHHAKCSKAGKNSATKYILGTATDDGHLESGPSLDVDLASMTAASSSVTGEGRMDLNESIVVQLSPRHDYTTADQQSRLPLATAVQYGRETAAFEAVVSNGVHRNQMEMGEAVHQHKYPSERLVRPWEGETIHEVSCMDEGLELTLGNSRTKGSATPPEVSSRTLAMSID